MFSRSEVGDLSSCNWHQVQWDVQKVSNFWRFIGSVEAHQNNYFTKYYGDVDKFVENGVNGFYADTAKELAEILCYLMEHPEETRNIGLKSRELAIKTFHIDRFLNDWKTIIGKTLGISIDDL